MKSSELGKEVIKKELPLIPKSPGVYRMLNHKDDILYVGKAKNLPILVFTHPKDPYDGLLSNWVEKIPGIKRIVISEKYKINNKNCSRVGINNGGRWKEKVKNGHYMAIANCFQYYNPEIIKFIESKI